MSLPLVPYLVIAAWFLACWGALAVISRAYVRALLVVGALSPTAKILSASFLWLAFALIALLPLFGGIALANRAFALPNEWPSLVWCLVCYVASLVPVYKAINGKHLPKLQSAGFFKE